MFRGSAGGRTAATAETDARCQAVVDSALTASRKLKPEVRANAEALADFQHCYWFTNAQREIQTHKPEATLKNLDFAYPMSFSQMYAEKIDMRDQLAYLKMIMMIMVSKALQLGLIHPDQVAYPAVAVLLLARACLYIPSVAVDVVYPPHYETLKVDDLYHDPFHGMSAVDDSADQGFTKSRFKPWKEMQVSDVTPRKHQDHTPVPTTEQFAALVTECKASLAKQLRKAQRKGDFMQKTVVEMRIAVFKRAMHAANHARKALKSYQRGARGIMLRAVQDMQDIIKQGIHTDAAFGFFIDPKVQKKAERGEWILNITELKLLAYLMTTVTSLFHSSSIAERMLAPPERMKKDPNAQNAHRIQVMIRANAERAAADAGTTVASMQRETMDASFGDIPVRRVVDPVPAQAQDTSVVYAHDLTVMTDGMHDTMSQQLSSAVFSADQISGTSPMPVTRFPSLAPTLAQRRAAQRDRDARAATDATHWSGMMPGEHFSRFPSIDATPIGIYEEGLSGSRGSVGSAAAAAGGGGGAGEEAAAAAVTGPTSRSRSRRSHSSFGSLDNDTVVASRSLNDSSSMGATVRRAAGLGLPSGSFPSLQHSSDIGNDTTVRRSRGGIRIVHEQQQLPGFADKSVQTSITAQDMDDLLAQRDRRRLQPSASAALRSQYLGRTPGGRVTGIRQPGDRF